MSLPTENTAGYSLYADTGKVGCDCLCEWLPVAQELAILKGYIKYNFDILQLTGLYAASGGTHQAGGVFDVKQFDPRIVALFREMGAPATWQRYMYFDSGAPNFHTHGVLSGCAHNWPAAYQITAQARGYNGMGQGTASPYVGVWGYGGKDSHPDPVTYRTWKQGITWAKAEIVRLKALQTPVPPPPPTDEEILMAITVLHPTNGTRVPLEDALWSMWFYAYTGCLAAQKAAAAAGADVDEKALAAEVALILQPALQAALSAGLNGLTDEDAHKVAAATIAEIAGRFATPA